MSSPGSEPPAFLGTQSPPPCEETRWHDEPAANEAPIASFPALVFGASSSKRNSPAENLGPCLKRARAESGGDFAEQLPIVPDDDSISAPGSGTAEQIADKFVEDVVEEGLDDPAQTTMDILGEAEAYFVENGGTPQVWVDQPVEEEFEPGVGEHSEEQFIQQEEPESGQPFSIPQGPIILAEDDETGFVLFEGQDVQQNGWQPWSGDQSGEYDQQGYQQMPVDGPYSFVRLDDNSNSGSAPGSQYAFESNHEDYLQRIAELEGELEQRTKLLEEAQLEAGEWREKYEVEKGRFEALKESTEQEAEKKKAKAVEAVQVKAAEASKVIDLIKETGKEAIKNLIGGFRHLESLEDMLERLTREDPVGIE